MGNKKITKNEYITTTELARLCGVSRFTIINWIEQGRIDCVKTAGGHRRIRRSEADNIIEAMQGKGEEMLMISDAQVENTEENLGDKSEDTLVVSENIAENVEEGSAGKSEEMLMASDIPAENDGEISTQDIRDTCRKIVRKPAGKKVEAKKHLLKSASYVVGCGLGGIREGLVSLKRSLMWMSPR